MPSETKPTVPAIKTFKPIESFYLPSSKKVSPTSGISSKAPSRSIQTTTGIDSVYPLVLMIDFADKVGYDGATATSDISNTFFGVGTGSVADYWTEVSYGKFFFIGDNSDINPVSNSGGANVGHGGWLRAGTDFSTTITSYTNIADVQTTNVSTLIKNAVDSLALSGVDFAGFVSGTDNVLPAVIIFHSGAGQEDSGSSSDPYSHMAHLVTPITFVSGGGTYKIEDYVLVPSRQYNNGAAIGIGVIVHEIGHLFGLPDLYPTQGSGQTNDSAYTGVGVFDLMAYGMWGGNGETEPIDTSNPSHISAWAKAELGWLTPTVASRTSSSSNVLHPIEMYPDAAKVYQNGHGDESQYLLLEHRRNDGPQDALSNIAIFDRNLPGSGVLVWRVDKTRIDAARASNTVNDNNESMGLSLVEADTTGSLPHLLGPLNAVASMGVEVDFFGPSSPERSVLLSRSLPVVGYGSKSTNTAPIHSDDHLFDVGFFVRIWSFVVNSVSAVFSLDFTLPSWTFLQSVSVIGSDNVTSYGFDSANRVWIGTNDKGVRVYDLTRSTEVRDLPLLALGQSLGDKAPIQSMAFDALTGSMWVGTSRNLVKVRHEAAQVTLPSSSSFTIDAKAIAVAPYDVEKRMIWVGGGRQFAFAIDDGTNQPSGVSELYQTPVAKIGDDFSGKFSSRGNERITALALDVSAGPSQEVLFVGTSEAVGSTFEGRIYWNMSTDNEVLPLQVAGTEDDATLVFRELVLPENPGKINGMAVDEDGRLWVATDKGVFAHFAFSGEFDPFDILADGDLYMPLPIGESSTGYEARGVAVQDTGEGRVVWAAWNDSSGGGFVQRIDVGALQNTTHKPSADNQVATELWIDNAIMVFQRNASALNEGPGTNDLTGAFGDGVGGPSVWFSSPDGAVAFRQSSVTLDKLIYLDEGAEASVSLLDGTNLGETATVHVTSGSDAVGIDVVLSRGDSGVFIGTFTMGLGSSDAIGKMVKVKPNDAITVSYDRDPDPATAIWTGTYPFDDGFIVNPLCFVSTAAYGSSMSPEVVTLRSFRDQYLAKSVFGRGLVSLYYEASPRFAEWIARGDDRRAAARVLLAPPVLVATFMVKSTLHEKMFVLGLLALAAFFVAIVGFRRPRHA